MHQTLNCVVINCLTNKGMTNGGGGGGGGGKIPSHHERTCKNLKVNVAKSVSVTLACIYVCMYILFI